jgi:hypothetical protein
MDQFHRQRDYQRRAWWRVGERPMNLGEWYEDFQDEERKRRRELAAETRLRQEVMEARARLEEPTPVHPVKPYALTDRDILFLIHHGIGYA